MSSALSLFRTLDGSFAILRTATLVLITFLAATSQYFVLWPWYTSSAGSVSLYHLALFNTGILFIYWTFFLACQDPGAVVPEYVPANDAGIRYCKKCDAFKPPRTHHCRSCNRCILRMDHHCPWLSGCVGYRNHAAFIKFLCCVVPTTTYLASMMGYRFYDLLMDSSTEELDTTCLVLTSLNFLGAFGVTVMVLCLLLYQLWCICDNITTIESWSKKRTEDLVRRKKIPPIEFPYDLYSTTANLKEILGHHSPLILWLWPPTHATGTGHEFPMNDDADTTQPWPPAEPTALDSPAHGSATVEDDRERSLPHRDVHDSSDSDWDEYLRLESSDDDYVDGDGEYLDSYGVDDDHEITKMANIVRDNVTLGQLLTNKRATAAQNTGMNQKGKLA